MSAYSLADVVAAIDGPGGTFQLGAGIGVAKEGITIEPKGDTNIMTEGGDGAIMHSLRVSKAGVMTITLLRNSPSNAKLMNMYNYQTSSSRYHGQNVITVQNTVTGDLHTGTQMAFQKKPGLPYTEEGGSLVWTFEGIINTKLGSSEIPV